MSWKKVLGKFLKHALISIPVALVPILTQAEGISSVDWDKAGLALLVAVLSGGAIGGGLNAQKHARKGSVGLWALLCLLLVSCAGTQRFENNKMAFELGTRAVTARVLEENPKWRSYVIDLADGYLAVADQTEAPLGTLEQHVRERVPWDQMLPEEKAVAVTALGAIRERLENYLAERGVENPAAQRVVVTQLVRWVRDTADL